MEPKPIDIIQHIYEIGAHDHKLAMRELKPLASLGFEQRTAFWPAWQAVAARRRAEIARAMVDLAEDNVDLDFGQALIWLLDDDDAEVRASAAAGLWENERPTVLRRLIELLHDDPAPAVRAAAATSLGRAAYHAQLDELDAAGAQALRTALERLLLDPRQPLEVRRRALESAGYFADEAEIQRQVGLAYASNEQLLRESALVAMGRSMLPRWLPMIAESLTSPSPALRYEAARAVGELGEEGQSLLPKLAPLLNDQDSEVAFAAIWSLGQVGGDTARRLLKQIAKDGDTARRQAANDALEELALGESMF